MRAALRKLENWRCACMFALAALLAACGGGEPAGTATAHPLAGAPQQSTTRTLPDFRHMRAVHMMGNWLGNTRGFAEPLLAAAPALSATQVQIQGSLSTFTDGQGVTHTNDMALVRLTAVKLGATTLQQAGFWMYRDKDTGALGLQFRPQLDTSLAGVSGFSGDVNITLPQTGGSVSTDDLANATGDARSLVLAVLAHAPELVATATATLGQGATLGQPATLSAALGQLRTGLQQSDAEFFAHLKSMHVEWIGISVGLHYDSYSDPTVRVRNCPTGTITDSGGTLTSCAFPDADLVSFIGRAKAAGFQVYLTLAFETALDIDSTSNPVCNTPAYKMSRWWLGAPALPANERVSQCIPASAWWWSPSHPDHASKVQAFFSSYQAAAVRYATIAQATGVGLYSLGTETENLFRTRSGTGDYSNHFRPQLQAMVDAVRAVYAGALTYDQHSNALVTPQYYGGSEALHHVFDDLDLDVVGISAYFQLAATPPHRVLSLTEMESAWEGIFQSALEPLRARYPGKPIVFTEVGYTDDVNSPHDQGANAGQAVPAHEAGTSTPGMVQQDTIYKALFNVNARHGDLVAGTFFWGNDYYPFNGSGCGVVDWGLRCHALAKATVTSQYAAWKRQDADRVFSWGAAQYPQFFSGAQTSGQLDGYYFRHHAGTQIYLGLNESTGEVYAHGGPFSFYDAGSLRSLLDLSARAGF